jgi:hypothetical protein
LARESGGEPGTRLVAMCRRAWECNGTVEERGRSTATAVSGAAGVVRFSAVAVRWESVRRAKASLPLFAARLGSARITSALHSRHLRRRVSTRGTAVPPDVLQACCGHGIGTCYRRGTGAGAPRVRR